MRDACGPRAPKRARGRTFVCQQLAATETEDGAQVTWERSVYRRTAGGVTGRAVEPAVLTYRRLSPEDLTADARACGLDASHVHLDPGDEASLGSTYCVLRQLGSS